MVRGESRENGITEIDKGQSMGPFQVMKRILDFVPSVMGDPRGLLNRVPYDLMMASLCPVGSLASGSGSIVLLTMIWRSHRVLLEAKSTTFSALLLYGICPSHPIPSSRTLFVP